MIVHYLHNVVIVHSGEAKQDVEVKAKGNLSSGEYRVKVELDGNNTPFTFSDSGSGQIRTTLMSKENSGQFRFYGEWETREFLELMSVVQAALSGLKEVEEFKHE